jgi:hypothetical protein
MIRLFSALVLAIATVPIAKQHVPPTLQLTDALVVRRVRDRARRETAFVLHRRLLAIIRKFSGLGG